MQFYFRQFSGDENVQTMDLDTVGAHILLMCYAGASKEGWKVPNNRAKLGRLLGKKDDEDFARIYGQLTDGAWKVSQDGEWLVQDGMKRTLEKQRKNAKAGKKNADSRWDSKRDADRDAKPIVESCSSSSPSSTTTLKEKKEAKKPPKKSFVRPSLKEVIDYFSSKGHLAEVAINMFDHYEANGWKVGKVSMKDWEAAARNWMKRQPEFNNHGSGKTTQPGTMESLEASIRSHGLFSNNPDLVERISK